MLDSPFDSFRLSSPFGRRRGFSPADLFRFGEKGTALIVGPTNCFQDAAGTTPAGAGDPVGLVLDTSGNGVNATQSDNDDYRPTLQTAGGLWYLDFDWVDDYLVTPSIDFTGTDKMSVFAGVRKDSDSRSSLVQLGTSFATVAGSFAIEAPGFSEDDFRMHHTGSSSSAAARIASSAPVTAVLTGTSDLSAPEVSISQDGGADVVATTATGGGNYQNGVIYVGKAGSGSLFFNGRLYGLIVRGAESSEAEIDRTERYLAQKTGVTL